MAEIQGLLQSTKLEGFFQCELKPLKIVDKICLAQQSTVVLNVSSLGLVLIFGVYLDARPPFGDTEC